MLELKDGQKLESAHKFHVSPTVHAEGFQLSLPLAQEPVLSITRHRLLAVITSTALRAAPD